VRDRFARRRWRFATRYWPLLLALAAARRCGAAGWWRARCKPLVDRSGNEVARRGPQALAPLPPRGLCRRKYAPLVEPPQRCCSNACVESLEQERSFAANAAHELRNPLAALRAQAEVARDSQRPAGCTAAALDAGDRRLRPPRRDWSSSCCLSACSRW
jgi:signal transduction histidine kinase